MTFVIALLREQGASGEAVTLFYTLLGVAVVLSSRLWAGLLDRFKGGQSLAILNALLGVATILPALTASWPVALASGLLFGGVFLSVVASTTALVRHNLPPAAWGPGISGRCELLGLGWLNCGAGTYAFVVSFGSTRLNARIFCHSTAFGIAIAMTCMQR
jgi:predicted MFS family arabinose efflux permease